jgi:O-Antigen ligase
MLAWRAMETPAAPSWGAPGVGLFFCTGLVGAATLAALVFGGASGVSGIVRVGGPAVVLLALAVALFALGRLPLPALGREGWALVAVLLLLTAWSGVSIVWSIVPDRSWDVFNKTFVFAAFLGLGIVLAGVARDAAARVGALVLALGISAVFVWALLAKAIPALDAGGDRVARLRVPIDYWNALALLADAGLGLALWVGVGRGRPALRVAGALLAYASTLALLLTLSRAGLAAGFVVVLLSLALSQQRVGAGVLLVAGAVPAAAVGGWAFTRPALVEDGAPHADRVSDGAIFAVLAVLGALVVVAAALMSRRLRVAERDWRLPGSRPKVGAGIAAAVAAGALVVAVVSSRHDISGSCSQVVNQPSRITSLNTNNRWCWWTEAWKVFVHKVPLGAGAGSFEVARKRYRKNAGSVVEPHSVPMQELSDGGVVGLLLFLALVGAGGLVCVRAVLRIEGPERAAGIALVTLPAAYLVHALVDYDWDFIAVTGPTMLALGVLSGAGRKQVRPARGNPLLVAACAVVAVTLLASFAFPRLSERSGRAALGALDDGNYTAAKHDAEHARSLDPLAVDPLWTLAAVAARQDRDTEAVRRYVQAVELQPENPDTWYALGMYEYQVVGDNCLAYRYLNNAYTLDSAGTEWVPGGALDRARAAVNAGACER